MSLITSGSVDSDGPLSGSFHNQRTSPQNSATGAGVFTYPDNDARPLSPSSGGDHLKREITKTLSLDRSNDIVYAATTNVVKAIMALSQGVEKAVATEYLELVRNVGIELRTLLASVDSLAAIFPPQAHK